jgi:integrase
VERYATLLRAHIIPGLGSIELQKLDGSAIDRFYATRREKGLASLTLHHVHSLLRQVLASAVKAKKLARSPIADIETAPKAKRRDKIEVLDEAELATLLDHLRGHWLYMPTLVAASTGLRRGEVLGLRWRDIDFAKGILQVTQAVEVVGGKLGVKPPKTDRSARTIKLPSSLAPELEQHRKEQLEQRLKLGLGGRPDLVFTSPLGKMLQPDSVSEAFVNRVAEIEIKPITFHGLRHTQITLLLGSGVPVHVVSARAGYAKASITLDIPPSRRRGERCSEAGRGDLAAGSKIVGTGVVTGHAETRGVKRLSSSPSDSQEPRKSGHAGTYERCKGYGQEIDQICLNHLSVAS